MSGIMLLSVGNSYGSKPENTSAPSVGGVIEVGSTLSANVGTWIGTTPITYSYQWKNNNSNISGATSSTYTLQVSDQGDQISVAVTATNDLGSTTVTSAQRGPVAANTGQQQYTSPGTYSWIAPVGVSSISVVAVGAGAAAKYVANESWDCFAGGGGGALAYKNNYAVTAGNSYTVVVGTRGSLYPASGSAQNGGNSRFNSAVCEAAGGTPAGYYTDGTQAVVVYGDGGGSGGVGGRIAAYNMPGSGGGGGAGGYSGAGGSGGQGNYSASAGNNGSGGGAGGGASGTFNDNTGGGGGVGIFGEGSSGAGGAVYAAGDGYQGGGGSGGGGGGLTKAGGSFGGGSSGRQSSPVSYPAHGAVRIIWPGNTRSFPSTNTGNL